MLQTSTSCEYNFNLFWAAKGCAAVYPARLSRLGAPKSLILLKLPGECAVPVFFFNPYGMEFLGSHQWGAATASSYGCVFFILMWFTFYLVSLVSLSLIKRKGNKNKGFRAPGECAG